METTRGSGITEAQVSDARRRLAEGGTSISVLADEFGVSSSSLQRHLNPDSAERQRESSRQWKARQIGICELCGGPTHYSAEGGTSRICNACNRLNLAKTGAKRRGQGSVVRSILEFLADGLEHSYGEIRDACGLSNAVMSNRLYQRLIPYGLIRRVGHGRYQITDEGLITLARD